MEYRQHRAAVKKTPRIDTFNIVIINLNIINFKSVGLFFTGTLYSTFHKKKISEEHLRLLQLDMI